MQNDDQLNQNEYLVLINDEEQYSIWLERLPIPGGWRSVGMQGSREECTSFVDNNWTDMRPKSLRQYLTQD